MAPASDVLSVDLETFQRYLAITTTSAFAAAREAVHSFDAKTDKEAIRTFIHTGNICNEKAILPLLMLGVGKAASSHIIDLAYKSYTDKGYKYVLNSNPAFLDLRALARVIHSYRSKADEHSALDLTTRMRGPQTGVPWEQLLTGTHMQISIKSL